MNEDNSCQQSSCCPLGQKRYLFWAIALVALAGVYLYASRPQAPAPPPPPPTSVWVADLATAQKRAAEQNKLLFVDFYATWCGPCQMMDHQVYPRQDVADAMRNWVAVKIDVDKQRSIAREYRITGMPTLIVLSPKGEELDRIEGGLSPQQFIRWITEAEKAWTAKHPAESNSSS
jgi:thiol:disulfide interchange protein